jgi:peptidoglycan glycosyltransferase
MKLADILSSEGLSKTFGEFGFLTSPNIEIETEEPSGDQIQDSRMAAIGQDSLSVSPLQVSLALAALANDGRNLEVKVLDAVQGLDGEWEENKIDQSDHQIIQKATADTLLDALLRHQGYAEYSVPVLSGPEGTTNTWYLGLAPAVSPQYAIVVVLEDNESIIDVEQIGRTMLGFASG